MKRILSFVLLFLVLSTLPAYAVSPTISRTDFDQREELLPLGTSTTVTHVQNCYIHVNVISDQADGEPISTVYSPVGFTITYKFLVLKRNGMYSGGEMLRNTWPEVKAVNNSLYDLDISVYRIAEPPDVTVSITDDSYTFIVSGGLIEVTYNSVVYVNTQGKQYDADSTTQQRAFYLNYTGP